MTMSRTREQPAYALSIHQALNAARNKDFACVGSTHTVPILEVRPKQISCICPAGTRPGTLHPGVRFKVTRFEKNKLVSSV